MKNNKKPTVTIGIPAYNEEANIQNLLVNLLGQKDDNFKLEKIIIVCDGSTDRTVEKAKSIKNKKIELIINKARKGQVFSQNTIFQMVRTDLVIILEADTLPADNSFIKKLVDPIKDSNIKVVQGNVNPFEPIIFFEKIITHQLKIYREISVLYKNNEGWVCNGRGGRLFKKDVYKKLRWPLNVPEDAYAYLWCRSKNIKIFFAKKAVNRYRIPQNFQDLLKERQKINSGKQTLIKYFSEAEINAFYKRSKSILARMLIKFLFESPLEFLIYLFIAISLKRRTVKKQFTDFWPNTPSTKLTGNLNI